MKDDGTTGTTERDVLFRLLVENVLDYAIFVIDPEGRVRTWSDGAKRFLGYDEEEIIGELGAVFFTPEDVQAGVPEQEMRQAVATGRGEDDRWHVRKDGSRFWAAGMMTPLWEEGGKLQGFAKIMRDQTEWKRADVARQESEARRAAVLETSLDGIITIDQQDRIVEFNPAAERIFGHRRQTVIGRKLADLIVPDRLRKAHYDGMARYLATGEGPVLGQRLMLPALRADGTEFPVELAIIRVPGEGPPLFTGYVRDITEREEQERRRAVQLAVTEALAEASTIDAAAPRILQAVCENFRWDLGAFWLVDPQTQTLHCLNVWHPTAPQVGEFESASREQVFKRGQGLPGRVWDAGQPVWVADVSLEGNFPRLALAADAGLHGAFAVPIQLGGEVLGVAEFFSRSIREPDVDLLGMMATLGGHIGQFVERKRSEERLRESEQRFRQLAEHVTEVFWMADPIKANMLYVSPAYEQTWGRTAESLYKDPRSFLEAVHPDDRERVIDSMRRQVRGEATLEEYRVVRPDGSVRWVWDRAFPVRDESGRVYRVAGVAEDITRRKLADEALKESESRLRRIVESNVVGLIVADFRGRVLEANDAFLSTVGYTQDDLREGRLNFLELTPPECRPLDERAMAEMTATGGHAPYETEYVRKDGARVPVLVGTSYLGTDPQGNELGVGFILDLTQRRKAERALRESEEQFRTAFELAAVGSVQVDASSGFIIRANRKFCEITGYTLEELKGFTPRDLTHPEDRDADWESVSRLLRGEIDTYTTDNRYVRKTGQPVWVNVTASLIRTADGTPLRTVGVVQDLTDRRRAEEELREANRRKDEFLAMLAHELRNPLAPIRSGLDLLAISDTDGEVIGAMQQQVTHLVRLVDDLLDVSRIVRGRVELRKEQVELASVVRRAVETIRPQIDARHQTLATSLPPEAVPLYADPVRLSQVIGNLLHNASKYNEDGGDIRLSARLEGSEAVVSVADNGIGIEPDLLPRVFDLFTQATRSIDRSQGGLGIGLTLVKSLIEMHDGSVEVHSDGLGNGSEFTIRLPVVERVESDRSVAGTASTTPQHRILVVDDNVPAAKMLARLLEKLGENEVFLAHDGPTALEAAKRHHPDIILLDIGLPKMDGYEVARRLRERPEFERTLVVALTGYGTEEDRCRSLHAGCDDHLVKPPGVDALKHMLNHPKLPTA